MKAKDFFQLNTLKDNQCTLVANTDVGIKKVASDKCDSLSRYNYQEPNWIVEQKIAEISAGCGTECSYSYFVNFKTGEISPNYYLVTILDKSKQLIIYPANDQQGHTLIISKIFAADNSTRILITRNVSFNVAVDVDKLDYKNGNLIISYFIGKDYVEKTEEIPIDDSIFTKPVNSSTCYAIPEDHKMRLCTAAEKNYEYSH